MTKNITIRDSAEIAEAHRIAKGCRSKTSTTTVIRLALQHGLPIAKQRLEALEPTPAKKG